MNIREMVEADYDQVYQLWLSCAGMGLNHLDDSKEGIARQLVETVLTVLDELKIHKVALVVFKRNAKGNKFWEKLGFSVREDLIYRNQARTEMVRLDT